MDNKKNYFFLFFFGFLTGSILCGVLFYLTSIISTTPVSVNNNLKNISLFTCPENCKNTILNLIENSKERIYCEMYHMSYLDYVYALINAKKRGVDVILLVDSKSYYCNNSWVCKYYKRAYSLLEDNGIKIIPINKYNIFHSKSCLFDNTLFIGSHNFTPTSAKKNREINILIKNDTFLNEEFLRIFNYDKKSGER